MRHTARVMGLRVWPMPGCVALNYLFDDPLTEENAVALVSDLR